MYTLLAAAVTTCIGITYRLRAGRWDAPFWLIAAAILAPLAVAELTSVLTRHRTARTARAGRTRRAHARKATR